MKDNRGTTLEIGQTVCFNLSGEIAIGVIKSLKKTPVVRIPDYLSYMKYLIKVEQVYPNRGNVSKVTSPRNVMVVFEFPRM